MSFDIYESRTTQNTVSVLDVSNGIADTFGLADRIVRPVNESKHVAVRGIKKW